MRSVINKVVAIIPIKKNSKRVKGKNFKKPELKNDTGLLKNTLEETTKQLVLDGMQS